MKNILQENMRRFGTKNLTEQEANVQTLTGKQLRKQGYEVSPGELPIRDADQYQVDPALQVVATILASGEMQLTAKLSPEQKQRIRARKARMVFRKIENSKFVIQYVELI